MENTFSLALCTMVIHLAGRFIWYESFRDYISKKKRNYAALSFLALGLVNLLIFTYLFSQPGRLVPIYKTSLALGWLPYFLLSFLWLPKMVAQQVFVLGMQGLWISFLHTLSMISVMAMVQDLSLIDKLNMELIGDNASIMV